MGSDESRVQDIAELKEEIQRRITKHEEEIEFLKKNLELLDDVLKRSSFTKASSIKTEDVADTTPITRGADGPVIANAHVTPAQVSIVIDGSVSLDEGTPPFRSFFMDRIIGEMVKKDAGDADGGALKKDEVIGCDVEKDGTHIKKIVIRNYRDQQRLQEIIRTAGWSFTRMLESQGA